MDQQMIMEFLEDLKEVVQKGEQVLHEVMQESSFGQRGGYVCKVADTECVVETTATEEATATGGLTWAIRLVHPNRWEEVTSITHNHLTTGKCRWDLTLE